MNNLTICDIEGKLRFYLEKKHPKQSNGILIRLSDELNEIYERRRLYIVKFPHIINQQNIESILNKWSEYALNDIIDNYNLMQLLTIVSIDPIKLPILNDDIVIQFGGETINPETIIRKLCLDIINEMNKHIVELYTDNYYPEVNDINTIINEIELEDIYNKYPEVEIYIPLKLKTEDEDVDFYLNGTIKTTNHIIDIIDDIRLCISSNDINEKIEYEKEEIIYKFGNNKSIQNFSIITDPQI